MEFEIYQIHIKSYFINMKTVFVIKIQNISVNFRLNKLHCLFLSRSFLYIDNNTYPHISSLLSPKETLCTFGKSWIRFSVHCCKSDRIVGYVKQCLLCVNPINYIKTNCLLLGYMIRLNFMTESWNYNYKYGILYFQHFN